MSQIVSSAARLKVEVRLGKAVSDFRDALENEQKTRFDALQAGGPPMPADVVKLAEEINAKGEKMHPSWKPHGTRVQNALGVIQTLTAAGDVMIGGSQNLIAAGAWAAIRVALVWSVTYLSLFDKISEKLMRIGRSASIRQDTVGLFPHDTRLREMVLEYLIVVVEMSQSFVDFRKSNQLARVVAAASISREMQEYEDRLSVWATLINEQVQFLHSQVSVETRKSTTIVKRSQELFSSTWKKEKDRVQCRELMKFLSPHQPELDRAWARHRKKGNVKWLFRHADFHWWLSDIPRKKMKYGSVLPHHLLITGSIGQGKSVLMANIVSYLITEEDAGLVAAVFCERSNAKTLDSDTVIGSIVQQLVKAIVNGYSKAGTGQIPEELTTADHTRDFQKLAMMTAMAAGEAARLGPRYKKCFIVLDGIGYLPKRDAVEVFNFIETLRGFHRQTRACISMSSGSSLFRADASKWTNDQPWMEWKYLNMATDAFNDELHDYVRQELASRPGFQALSTSVQDLIRQTITDLAGGLHVWASLQIDRLFPAFSASMPTKEDILGMISQLPRELHELFDAALQSITDTRYQPGIFELVIAAKRPLTVSEILIALSVKVNGKVIDRHWSETDIPLWTNPATAIYECSGGLLELDEEHETVHFVHDSVWYYLTDKNKDWATMLQSIHAAPPGSPPWQISHRYSDIHFCRICLKYLDLPFHGTQLIKVDEAKQKQDHSKAVLAIPDSLASESSAFKAAGRAIRMLPRRGRAPISIDLTKVAESYIKDRRKQRERSGSSEVKPTALLDYASTYWLEHCDHWMVDDNGDTAGSESLYVDSLDQHFQKALRGRCAATTALPDVIKGLVTSSDLQPEVNMIRYESGTVLPPDFTRVMLFKRALGWIYKHSHMRLFWAAFDFIKQDLHWFASKKSNLTEMQQYISTLEGSDLDSYKIVWLHGPAVPADMVVPFLNIEKSDDDGRKFRVAFDVSEYFNVYRLQSDNHDMKCLFRFLLVANQKEAESRGNIRLKRAIHHIQMGMDWQRDGLVNLDKNQRWRLSAVESLISSSDIGKLLSAARFLRPVLSEWWCQCSIEFKSPEAFQVISALRWAKVPCHLRNLTGVTPLRLSLELTRNANTFEMWDCHDCRVQDHPPGTLALAVRLWRVDLVVSLCERDRISNTDIFWHFAEYEQGVVEIEHSDPVGSVDMVTALNRAGGDVLYEPHMHGFTRAIIARPHPSLK